MTHTIADRIWNRAALEAGGPDPRQGDSALAALLLAHSLLMNGGFEDALSSLSNEEVRAAIAGYRFFTMTDAAELIELASSSASSADLEAATGRYYTLVPDDGEIEKRFHSIFASAPDEFAPI